MGRSNNDSKTSPLLAYSDENHGGSSFFSSTIPLQNQVPLEDEEPPAYSDSTTGVAATLKHPEGSDIQRRFHHSTLDAHDITCRNTHRDTKGSTTTVLSCVLSSDPDLLQDFVAIEARVMPNPTVRMMGTHTETRYRDKREESTTVTDFDITVSLANLLVSPWRRTRVVENGVKAYRGGRTRSNGKGFKVDIEETRPPPSLKEWCHRFCASSASLKTFTISRKVTNRDDRYLIDALTGVLRSTNYRGSISITFPLEDRATIVMSDHPINRYRTNRLIWWICVIFQLWIITWPLLWLMTKHWEVLSVYWPCRIFEDETGGWPNADEEHAVMIHEGTRPDDWDVRRERDVRLATMSEMSWVEDWRGTIMRAAEDKRRGILHISDKNSAQAEEQRYAERAWETRERFAPASQASFTGAAAGFLRGAGDVMRDSRLARGWGGNT